MHKRVLGYLTLAAMLSAAVQAQTFGKREMEELVGDILEQRTGVRATSVECPVATPIGIGNRSVCSATGPGGATFSVELIQKDEEGGVNYTVTDAQAIESLEPLAKELVDLWKADDVERIYREGHQDLHRITRLEDFTQLLRCTAADFGGVGGLGETEGAAIHRGDGSAQIITAVHFGAGQAAVTLNYMSAQGEWKLRGISLPIPMIDFSKVDTEDLVRHAARLFEQIDDGDWGGAIDMLSYELRGEQTEEDIREALDDPWQLGVVKRLEMTAFGRNSNDLPLLMARIVRDRGEQRAWLAYRSCGDDWKLRVVDLLDPAAEPPVTPITEVQTDILQSLAERGVEISLTCPGSEIAAAPGIVYTCLARHESGLEAPLEISVGQEGAVSWQILADDSWDPLFE